MSFFRSEEDRAAAKKKALQQKEFLEAQMVDKSRSRAEEARQANAELIKELQKHNVQFAVVPPPEANPAVSLLQGFGGIHVEPTRPPKRA